jgi:hypothetical protein
MPIDPMVDGSGNSDRRLFKLRQTENAQENVHARVAYNPYVVSAYPKLNAIAQGKSSEIQKRHW